MDMLATFALLLMCQITSSAVMRPRIDYDTSTYSEADVINMARDVDWSFVVPGTNWCGDGNAADNYDDLGLAADTDMCCRAHDFCDDYVEGGQTYHNLTNPTFYTRLNCKCDDALHQCLKNADSFMSNVVGFAYFNILGTQCFREDYPIIECNKSITVLLTEKCVEYEYDTSKNKTYQWFDVPKY